VNRIFVLVVSTAVGGLFIDKAAGEDLCAGRSVGQLSEIRVAVDLGLPFISKQQNVDGSFKCDAWRAGVDKSHANTICD
jgi:hypothetical protein